MFDFVVLNEILASGLMPSKCWHFLVYRECFDLLVKDEQNKTCFISSRFVVLTISIFTAI